MWPFPARQRIRSGCRQPPGWLDRVRGSAWTGEQCRWGGGAAGWHAVRCSNLLRQVGAEGHLWRGGDTNTPPRHRCWYRQWPWPHSGSVEATCGLEPPAKIFCPTACPKGAPQRVSQPERVGSIPPGGLVPMGWRAPTDRMGDALLSRPHWPGQHRIHFADLTCQILSVFLWPEREGVAADETSTLSAMARSVVGTATTSRAQR